MVTSAAFSEALSFVDTGDIDSLEALLRKEPGLLRERATQDGPPYDGYFRAATLLHHTAGNPFRNPLPSNNIDIVRLLLDRGADVDAATHFGDWSWTALGLAATSSQLIDANQELAMLEMLLEYGADVDWGNGLALYGALFHVTEDPRLLRSARYLAIRGATLDLALAAGVGSIETVTRMIESDPLSPDAYCMYRFRENRVANPGSQFVLDEALLVAAVCGQTECARILVERGAKPDAMVGFGRHEATALHWAAYVGWPDMVELLLDSGANPELKEPQYTGTALDWAKHAGKEKAIEILSR